MAFDPADVDRCSKLGEWVTARYLKRIGTAETYKAKTELKQQEKDLAQKIADAVDAADVSPTSGGDYFALVELLKTIEDPTWPT